MRRLSPTFAVFASLLMPDAAPASAGPLDEMRIECAGPFARDANEASLIAAFGKAAVVRETIDGPEGSSFEGSVVFPDDPAKRLVVVWWDEAKRARPSAIIVEDASTWVAPGGVRLGATIADVTAQNGGPFMIAGFGWDYGGSAGFAEGKLAQPAGGCFIGVSFDPGDRELGARFDAIMGDRQISSEEPLMREAAPKVVSISVGYPAE